MKKCFTPSGRYCFKRLPFGITSASEIFQPKMEDQFMDIAGIAVLQDDLIVFGRNIKEHDVRLGTANDRVNCARIKFNKDKYKVRKACVSLLGERFCKDDMSPVRDATAKAPSSHQPTRTGNLLTLVTCRCTPNRE